MKHLYIIILILAFTSCEEYYEPNIDKQDPAFAFDALITDRPGPYYIRVTTTNGYSNDTMNLVDDANVIVKCSDSCYYSFTYGGKGYYYSDSILFVGEVGKSYQMQVTTKDGDVFTSEWEEMLPCPDIDGLTAIYYETKKIKSNGSAYFDEVESGITVMNNTNASGYTPFYKYECELTLQTRQYYPGIVPEERYVYRPFIPSGSLYIADARQYNGNKIIGNKLFATPRTMFEYRNDTLIPDREFVVHYCGEYILVKQLSLSENQYNYWLALNDQQKENNYLFGQFENQPQGNISCSSEKKTLGYFCVSAVKESIRAFSLTNKFNNIVTYDIDYFPHTDTVAFYENEQDFTIIFTN